MVQSVLTSGVILRKVDALSLVATLGEKVNDRC